MFRRLARKTRLSSKYLMQLALFQGVSHEFVISPFSTVPKDMSFRSQSFNFSFVVLLAMRSSLRRASTLLFIYTLCHILDIKNADSRSQRFAFKRHCTRCSPHCRKGPLGPFRVFGRCRRLRA